MAHSRTEYDDWNALLKVFATHGIDLATRDGGRYGNLGEKQVGLLSEQLRGEGLALVPLARVIGVSQRLPEPSEARRVLAEHRDTLTDDAVIDAIDWLLDAVTADREYLAIAAQRAATDDEAEALAAYVRHSKPLRCRLGIHKFPAASGVGPCERGCGTIRQHAVHGGMWIRHVERPKGDPPRGMPPRPTGPREHICLDPACRRQYPHPAHPPRPEPDRLTTVPGPP